MHFSIIHTIEELETLAGEWNALLKQSASDVPFLRHEYLTAWWKTLGGGEWPEGELLVVIARDGDGGLLGIAPLFCTSHGDRPRPSLLFLGSIEISDYLDVIARPEHVSAFVAGALDVLAEADNPDWVALDLYNLLDSSPTIVALQAAAEGKGWEVRQEALQHCPSIHLPGDFEKYLAEQVEKKQRHEIRRKMRRAQEYEQPVRWYIAEEPANLDDEIDAFLALMAHDSEKDRFLTEAMCTQMRTALQVAYHGGWLQLAFLEVGGRKAAGYLNFDYADTIWVYNSGLDFSFRELSPGWVLLGHLLQWANEHQRKVFDFMRGDEEYKYRFGAVDRRVVRVTIRR
ncbi:MAG: GNAT family N-acetyltransferase [Anaerolineales bacterium]|nr:GNAT family N-acetyltransferase [Anaerolineales bacterium]